MRVVWPQIDPEYTDRPALCKRLKSFVRSSIKVSRWSPKKWGRGWKKEHLRRARSDYDRAVSSGCRWVDKVKRP